MRGGPFPRSFTPRYYWWQYRSTSVIALSSFSSFVFFRHVHPLPFRPVFTTIQASEMNSKPRSHYYQGYCLCQSEVCARIQKQLGLYRGRLLAKDGVYEWCSQATPLAIHFHPLTSTYTSWLLILSICYHIPVFLETFLKDLGDDVRIPILGQQIKMKKWLINRIHFPAILLWQRGLKKLGLTQNTTLMSPGIARRVEELDRASVFAAGGEGPNPLTLVENTVGFLEDYAERVLPANVYQEFLQAKRKRKSQISVDDFFVQAPGVSSREVIRFCSLLNLAITTDDDTTINIVPTRELVMVAPLPPRIWPYMQHDHRQHLAP